MVVISRRVVAVGVAGTIAVAGIGLYAGALTLATPGALGAGNQNIQASCTNSVSASPGAATWNAGIQSYAYSTVTVTGTFPGCVYQEASATVYNNTNNTELAGTTSPHVISSTEVTNEAFTITLDTPVDASLTTSNINIGLVIESTTTHDTVTNISGTAGYYSINLTWTAPDDNGGVAPLGYKIEYAEDDNGSPGTYNTYIANTYSTSTSQNVSGLTPGTQYWFRITAYNVHGLADSSAQAAMPNGVVPYTIPGAPTAISASTGSQTRELDVSWTAPASNGYSAITGYKIEVRRSSDPDVWYNWTTIVSNTGNSSTSDTITVPIANQSYYVRVSAINAGGTGTAGTSVSPATSGS